VTPVEHYFKNMYDQMKIDVISEFIISPLEVEAMNILFQFYQMFPHEMINSLFVVRNLVCLLSLTHDLMPYIKLVIAKDVMTSAKHSCTVVNLFCFVLFFCFLGANFGHLTTKQKPV
jgi:hypothetical protein